MCGICGIALKDSQAMPDRFVLEAMNRVLRHRGPDEENFFTARGIGFGHQRLSVIDLATGRQPMQNETGKLSIVFNGEIYNFQELRRELEKKGHPFKSQSDTEVILHLYEEKGKDCVRDLQGMFAFALWDEEKRELFLARDRMGKKPLYYSQWNQNFYFASEIKAILQVPGFPREPDPQSIRDFVSLVYIPYPKTAFRHVDELPPAHTLLWRRGSIEIQRYWRPSFRQKTSLSFDEACEQTRGLLKEATRLRLISDVPLGAFLSGGIDSSTVVAMMAELSSRPVKTFTIGYDESDFNERPFAREISNYFGTEHEELLVRPDALEILPKLVWHYDQPFGDSSAVVNFYVAKMARSRVTVILNGDGGDENFGGYPRYLGLELWTRLSCIPYGVRKAVSFLAPLFGRPDHSFHFFSRLHRFLKFLPMKSVEENYLKLMIQFSERDRAELFKPEFLAACSGAPEEFLSGLLANASGREVIDRVSETELLSYLPCDLLTKMDRATMAYGLEARSPFLDHRVIEFASSLPVDYKVRGLTLKYILKKMMKGRLPDAVLRRPKIGFAMPVSRWFRTELSDYVREILLDPQTLARPYFQKRSVERLIRDHQSRRSENGQRLWTLLMLELWHRNFIDRSPLEPRS